MVKHWSQSQGISVARRMDPTFAVQCKNLSNIRFLSYSKNTEFCVMRWLSSTASTIMRNPYFSLLGTAWKYARQERKRFVLIYAMFIMANIIVAMNPLFYGWFVTELQKKGAAILEVAWIYVLGYLGLRLLEWTMHGPARVMEQQLAFNISRNFQEDLYGNILRLPVQWHQRNHSGATISKSRKAHEALRAFFSHGFIYLY